MMRKNKVLTWMFRKYKLCKICQMIKMIVMMTQMKREEGIIMNKTIQMKRSNWLKYLEA